MRSTILRRSCKKREISKKSLRICYPDIQSYSSANQEDASQAFFDIVRCLPRLENNLKIINRKIWTYLLCNYEEERFEEDTTFISLLHIHQGESNLQSNIDNWCNQTESTDKRCSSSICPSHYQNGQLIEI